MLRLTAVKLFLTLLYKDGGAEKPLFIFSTKLSAIMYLRDLVWRKSLFGENMETTKFVYYQENDVWVGWLEEFPDYRTQGTSLDELKENLKDIYRDLSTGKIPHARKIGELMVG